MMQTKREKKESRQVLEQMNAESTLLVHLLCVLYKKHNIKNAPNESKTFIESPFKRLKEDSLKL